MNKGFFIVVVKRRKRWLGKGQYSDSQLRSDLLEPIMGWDKTSGATIQLVAELQREQYHARIAMKKPVPDLISEACSLWQSGKPFVL